MLFSKLLAQRTPPTMLNVARETLHRVARGTLLLLLALSLSLTSLGCSETLLHGLTEDDANEVMVALESQGIAAIRKHDDARADLWMIQTPSNDAPNARRTLLQNGLPRREHLLHQDTSTAPLTSSIIRTSEHEAWELNVQKSRRLEASLRTMNGVLQARVHLIQPPPSHSLLTHTKPTSHIAHASVSLLVQPNLPEPIQPQTIAQWVSASVHDLSPDHVRVLVQERSLPTLPAAHNIPWEHVGPWSVAAQTSTSLKATLAILLLLVVGLCLCVCLLLFKIRRMRLQTTSTEEMP